MGHEVVVVRHGETEWSRAGRHTGRTDVPLTEAGCKQATLLGPVLGRRSFTTVLSSPLRRALDTCRLAGYAERVEVIDDLAEWDYGDYEGLTSAEIRDERPGWVIWDDGPAGGETLGEVSARADRVIARLRDEPDDAGHSLVFAHGHLLRVLAARWAGLQPTWAKALFLDPATVSVLGYEREIPAIRSWNADGAGR